MQLTYDFHIHSALSPCAENDMTPNNIINMAKLKGLDAIAVCDHNSTKNLPAAAKIAQEASITFLPGMEMTTAEEVHVLALFEDVDTAFVFGDMVYEALPDIPNKPDFFGEQLIMDENDEVIGRMDKLLISALPFDMDECCARIKEYGGYAIPAHINKGANSVLANLGFFPPQLKFKTIEVVKGLAITNDISGFQKIYSSDAHNLWQIAEAENTIEVDENTVSAILKKLCV
ncbi:MAG: PHP domain-containing protein [Christensenella sp.]|uniref:PHP domain-containing protein n=1 Tax=Christensenella sp. TaxID=1935934 RepID=UPI002B20CD89|nr:PHP domain-containing protein [Christensenella sp.]MEA5003621.1 PHP domain-containing protein [Christensenella sp.]